MKKKLRSGVIGLFLILTVIVLSGFSGLRDCDCKDSVYGEKSYAAKEKCVLLEVGLPIIFNFINGARICCRKGDAIDIKIKGCYEWHEKACQLGMSPEDDNH